MARLRTRRVGVRVEGNGSPLAEVVFHSVAVMDGRRVTQTWEELEVELLEDADDRELRRIGKALRQAGAEATDGRTKLAQALGVEAPARVEPDATTEGALRGMLRSSSSGSSRTTRVCVSATMPKTCTRCASRRGACARSCAPLATPSTAAGGAAPRGAALARAAARRRPRPRRPARLSPPRGRGPRPGRARRLLAGLRRARGGARPGARRAARGHLGRALLRPPRPDRGGRGGAGRLRRGARALRPLRSRAAPAPASRRLAPRRPWGQR